MPRMKEFTGLGELEAASAGTAFELLEYLYRASLITTSLNSRLYLLLLDLFNRRPFCLQSHLQVLCPGPAPPEASPQGLSEPQEDFCPGQHFVLVI